MKKLVKALILKKILLHSTFFKLYCPNFINLFQYFLLKIFNLLKMAPPKRNALILEAQANLALNLLNQLRDDHRSCIVSPASISIVLAMAFAGAKKNTHTQIGQLLAKRAPESDVHEYFGELLGNGGHVLEMANKVYVADDFTMLNAFEEKLINHYGGHFEAVDFMQGTVTARKINKFVEQATHKKIRDLVQAKMFDRNTCLVLINAIYFKGNWANKFNANLTKTKTFHIDTNNTKQLMMMERKARFIFETHTHYHLLGMPYEKAEMFMFVLLPTERFGLAQMLNELDGKSLVELLKKRTEREVKVVLPKFKLESTHELNEPLTNLGLSDAFSRELANFSGISTDASHLHINKVVQKAFIEVNEQGTEAAAATSSVVTDGPSPRPSEFVADH